VITTGCSGIGTCGKVLPGDHMSATISESNPPAHLWSITLSDTSEAWSFSNTIAYNGAGTSAEWIVEAPSSTFGVLPLANYGGTVFDHGSVSGGSPNLVAGDGGVMVQRGAVVSTPSGPDMGDVGGPDGFAIAYGSSPPAPPPS
jgi:hypothetical protein